MNHNHLTISLVAVGVALVGVAGMAGASELRYQPMNPSFGGSPINGQYLFDQAVKQNSHKEDNPYSRRDPLETFRERLKSRVLNSLSTKLIDAMYGENASDHGTFQVDDLFLEYERQGDQLILTVQQGDGSETVIQLPLLEFTP